jgi:hypothetical protein
VEQNGAKIIGEDDDKDHADLASVHNDDDDDDDDGIDELDRLDEIEKEDILADTEVVHEAVSRLRQLSFAIINSTTIVLPAWCRHCKDANLPPNLIPRDVVTRWNSKFDMMEFALRYRKPIDAITVDKQVKFRKHELDEEHWQIIEELVGLLGVRVLLVILRPRC